MIRSQSENTRFADVFFGRKRIFLKKKMQKKGPFFKGPFG